MPMRTSSGRQFTMLVVRRTLGCSAISTMATTYGNGGPGIHGWWLIVNVATVARPDTGSGASRFE